MYKLYAMVYYRKYRPQTLDELDLVDVREKLLSILKNKNIQHAFLFTGPKGLGKTSSARILAKAINCEKQTDSCEPCNKCSACLSITNVSNIDVLEIDAASNRGIDEIRDLRERVKFAPSSLKYKVYIIDEVHMLTTDAFNALLKTLEEPPSHVIFILCTTEAYKIPQTIMSRAFHVTFHQPSKEELVRSLKRIVKGEKLKIDDDILGQIYELADGAFRDAAKILEELNIASGGEKIEKTTLEKIYKTSEVSRQIEKLLETLSKRDAKECLKIFLELEKQNVDFKTVAEKILSRLHEILLIKNGIVKGDDISGLSLKDIEKLSTLFSVAYKEIRFSPITSLPLELAGVKFCTQDLSSDSAMVKVSVSEEKKEAINAVKISPSVSVQDKKPEEVQAQSVKKEPDSSHGDLFKPNIAQENFFATLIDKVKKDNHSISGVLRGCKLLNIGEDKVEIEAKYKFHKDKLSEQKTIKILDERSSEILGREMKVEITLQKV